MLTHGSGSLIVSSFKHIEALWFANVANSLLWWTYIKAFWRAANSICGQKIQFKTTLKGASMLMNTAFRDLALPGLSFFLLLASLITGIVTLFQVRSCCLPSPKDYCHYHSLGMQDMHMVLRYHLPAVSAYVYLLQGGASSFVCAHATESATPGLSCCFC